MSPRSPPYASLLVLELALPGSNQVITYLLYGLACGQLSITVTLSVWSEAWGCHFPESPSQDGSGLELANKALGGHVIRGRETEPLFSRGTAADRCADVRLEAAPRWAS